MYKRGQHSFNPHSSSKPSKRQHLRPLSNMHNILSALWFSSCFFYITAYPCGKCVCSRWMGNLSCVGPDVTHLPESIPWVTHIDMVNTSISSFPDLDEWPSLYSTIFRDNGMISCEDIVKFREDRTNLMILSDCPESILLLPLPESHHEWSNLLILIPMICTGAVFVHLKRRFKLDTTRTNDILATREPSDCP